METKVKDLNNLGIIGFAETPESYRKTPILRSEFHLKIDSANRMFFMNSFPNLFGYRCVVMI